MKIKEITEFEPAIGDIVEFETDPDTVVEGVIVAETEDGYIFEFSKDGLTALAEAHGNSKVYDKCWTGYKKVPGKKRGEKGSCVEESSGYIPRNSQEARDPRYSSALTSDVTTHTMRDQISKFFPTAAPKDGQEQVKEAEYQGRTVALGKPMAGDVKKSKVYVKNDKGNVVKVNFGDPNMRIKKSNPARRKSFRARHNCENPGPRWKARYWSCRAW
jgi:hypothetical protein